MLCTNARDAVDSPDQQGQAQQSESVAEEQAEVLQNGTVSRRSVGAVVTVVVCGVIQKRLFFFFELIC